MRSRRLVVGIAVAMLLVGCAGVPNSGPLHLGRPIAAAGGGLADATVREVPAGPQPNATRVELVRGLLRAMIDNDDGYGVVRSYLAPGASWNAGGDITVYADSARVAPRASDAVIVSARRLGVVGPRGAYRVQPGTVAERLVLTRRSGEWRVSKLPRGVLLSANDAERLLQPASVYFLTPDGSRVVPEPVLEPPQEPGLATTLMRALMSGPGPAVAPGVRTAVPHGTSLLGNVPISADGVAEVDLSSSARQVSPIQLARLSAQVVWTLRQLTSVTGVRLLVNGDALTAPGVPPIQSARSWSQFDPAASPTSPGSLLVRAGRVVGLGTEVPRALRIAGLVAPRRNADGSLVAALRRQAGVRELLSGSATSRSLTVRLRAARFTAPSFGPDGRLFIGAGQALYAVPRSGASQLVALPDALHGKRIRALAVSPDGTRVALIVGRGAVEIATLAMSESRLSLREARVLLPDTSRASGLAWSDAGQVVTTVADGGGRDVVAVGLDGYQVQTLNAPGMPGDLVEVAAAPGEPVLASDSDGTWQLEGHRWRRLSRGIDPSYAGG